jgi:hypothetical protein
MKDGLSSLPVTEVKLWSSLHPGISLNRGDKMQPAACRIAPDIFV